MAYCCNCRAELNSSSTRVPQWFNSMQWVAFFLLLSINVRFGSPISFRRIADENQLALWKHLNKSFLNDNGTCNSIAINVHTYLVAFFFLLRREMIFALFLQSEHVKTVHQATSYAANYFWNGKGQHIKIKVAFNAGRKKSTTKRIMYGRTVISTKCDHLHVLGQSARRRIKWFLFMLYAKSLFVGLFIYLTQENSARRRRYNVLWCSSFISLKKSDLANQFPVMKFIHFSALILILSFRLFVVLI